MKIVSILVPMYGAEEYIEQCARSLFMQSYAQCKFIFVDDASQDRTLEVLRGVAGEFAHLSPKIKIIECGLNGGVAQARNRALDAATGDYFLFVDADDWVDEQIVERLMLRSIETQADICNAWCESVDALDRRTPTPAGWVGSKIKHLKALLGQSHIVPNHVRGMLFDRALFEKHGLRFTPKVDFGEDYSLLPQLVYHACKLSTLCEYLYYYRVENQGSYMNNIAERHIKNYIEAQKIVYDFATSLPDAARFQRSLMLGKLNIKKWILYREKLPQSYDQQLFGAKKATINYPLLWLYNKAIDSGNRTLVRLFSVVINLPLYIATRLYR